MNDVTPIVLSLPDEAATIRLGEDLALALRPGDCLALSGDLGAGKSTLARALLRAMADDETLEVPSPTFTLVQSYELRIPVSHFDLYRLGDASELDELGLDEALASGICLVEWPEMAEALLPPDRLTLRLGHEGQGRIARLEGPDTALNRIRRSLDIRKALEGWGYGVATRRYLTGDASVRAYETIRLAGEPATILMDWPRQPEGPAVLDGKPYPKVAHLAEDASPFIAISDYLRGIGLAAPEVLEADVDEGILLLEDFGADGVLDADGTPIPERYRESVACLAYLHGRSAPRELPAGPGRLHHIPDFDPVATTMEARLLVDWHLPWKRGNPASEAERQDYLDIWQALISELQTAETNLLLRDFHSPNIIWREHELGVKRAGLIDFQDAMIGPTAYDLASIVQDARVDIPAPLAETMMADYLALRHGQGPFDEAAFLKAFAIMSAQRNCKLAGLWVRLMQRDGKPGYMKHMPRTLAYLATALRHEALAPLQAWCRTAGIALPESGALL